MKTTGIIVVIGALGVIRKGRWFSDISEMSTCRTFEDWALLEKALTLRRVLTEHHSHGTHDNNDDDDDCGGGGGDDDDDDDDDNVDDDNSAPLPK